MYYGQKQLARILNEKYLSTVENGTYIDAGAYDGVADSNTYFFYLNKGWTGYCLEPVPIIYKALTKYRSKDITLNCALSNDNEEKEFTQVIFSDYGLYEGQSGNGSLNHVPSHITELENRKTATYEKFTTQCMTLDKLYTDYKITTPITLLSLDVEGHEGIVLSRLPKITNELHPKIIAVEYGHCGEEILDKTLLSLNYKKDFKDEINLIYIKG